MIEIKPNLTTLTRWFILGLTVQFLWGMGDVFFGYREFLLHKGYALVPFLIIIISVVVMHPEDFKTKSKNMLPVARMIFALLGNLLGFLFTVFISPFF